MSPITYKSFLSQAKMKVLRPDIAELGEKYKKEGNEETAGNYKAVQQSRGKPNGGMYSGIIQLPFYVCFVSVFPSSV
ncbi:YidC/Oxa1 family membrane protein insertase [Flavobacterium procerum]|uniref:YidC/Oxa1 family membrane protein insertase n=1 Tax=Flavobacterium procerum TaxID=1455569 RepID=UPI0035EC44AF